MLLHHDALYDALRISNDERSRRAARQYALTEALREHRYHAEANKPRPRWFPHRRTA